VKKKLLVLPLALLVAAFALAACGGSSSSGGDEASIESTIEEAATSEDPKICTELQTENWNEQEHPEGNALKECEETTEAGENLAESVNISNVKVNGESATAEVEITGTGLDGQVLEVELANEGGDWKMNETLQFTKFDPAGFAKLIEEKLDEEESVSPELAKCVTEGMESLSQKEAESFIFEKNFGPIEKAAGNCQ
jgi:predicted small secreted protein